MKKRKRKFFNAERKRNMNGLLFVSLFIVGLVFMYISYFAQTIIYSMNTITITNTGYTLEYKGFENYNFALFVDPLFVRLQVETLMSLGAHLIIVVVYALFISTILNQKMIGKAFIRAIFFLPVILATGIISQIEIQNILVTSSTVLSDEMSDAAGDGIWLSLNMMDMLLSIGFLSGLVNFVLGAVEGIYNIIRNSGVQIVIFLAVLQSISPSIYEAAHVEGCSGWEMFWKITMPLISPLIPVCIVWSISEYYLNPTNRSMESIASRALQSSDFGLSAAMSILNLLVLGLVVFIILFVVNKFVFYENKPQKSKKASKKRLNKGLTRGAI